MERLMSFDPIPEPKITSDYLKIKENEKHRIRIMGTKDDPSTFIQGHIAWDNESQPHREPYGLGKPCSKELKEIDRDGKPKLFWTFIVYHEDEKTAKIFEITQQTIKQPILDLRNNEKWGDPRNYVIEIGRTGTGMETVYSVVAEPPVEEPSQEVIDIVKEAKIDLRVMFKGENPFGALSENEEKKQKVKELVDKGEPVPEGMEVERVGSVGADAIDKLKSPRDKSEPVKDDIPF